MQMAWVNQLVAELGPNESWRAAPAEIRHLARRVHVPLFSRLLEVCQMGGSLFAQQFNVGFTLVGDVSYPGVFDPAHDAGPPHIPLEVFLGQGAKRWAEVGKVLQSSPEDESAIWHACIEEREKGWLTGPFQLDACATAGTVPVCRFAVWQHGKLRPCDNFRRSAANDASSVRTPISLPTVDHLAFLLDTIQGVGARPCSIFKADHANAYRQLPLRPSEARFAHVVARNPSDGHVAVFIPRTLLFGSSTAVAHYNALSRAISSIFARIFRVPVVGYFDDFAAPVPRSLARQALHLFCTLNAALGFDLKPPKCLVGSAVEFLGVVVCAGQTPVRVSVSDERRLGLLSTVSAALAKGELHRGEAEVLSGKLSFCHCVCFAKEGRSFMPRLYNQTRSTNASISPLLRSDLGWWVDYLSVPRFRSYSRRSTAPRWLLYTDAAGDGGLGAVLVPVAHERPLPPRIFYGRSEPEATLSISNGTSVIYALEVLAVARALATCGCLVAGGRVSLYVDNDASAAAIAKGCTHASAPEVNALVRCIWSMASSFDVALWIERVGTKSNPADAPSRARAPYPQGWLRLLHDLSSWGLSTALVVSSS